MGPKKAKKSDKPKEDEAKLAELRQQQQLAAKNELRRRMEDEAKISKVNSLKIMNQWRKIMRLAKAESLKKEIEILSQNHERDVDRKDAILQMLDRDLEEAEEQHQMALRTQLANIESLISLHDSRLYALERHFTSELNTLQADFAAEKEMMTAKFAMEKRELAAIIEAIDIEEASRAKEAQHVYEQLREEIRGRNHDEIDSLRVSLDDQLKDLEQEFENEHLQYLSKTQQCSHDFKEKSANDRNLNFEIKKKRGQIDNLQTMIAHWRAKSKQLVRETEERNRLLLEEKMSIQRHYQQLKQRIKIYRSTQNQRLLHLSQSANACKQRLQEKLDVARRVLQLSELSRRLETLEEQVLPFATISDDLNVLPSSDPNNSNNNSNNRGSNEVMFKDDMLQVQQQPATLLQTQANPTTSMKSLTKAASLKGSSQPAAHQSSVWNNQNDKGEFVAASDRLGNFYRQYNKVLLDSIAIEKEKERLALENAQLEDLIGQYISGTKLSNDVLAEDNPLFVVNGRANLNHDLPVRRAKPIVQDAVEIRNTAVRQQQSRY
jgi:hypothetical protein